MGNIRKTKIICTLGPATDEKDTLKQLMLEGMNAARFNFSHGTHEEQKKRLDRVKKLRKELNLPIATILDTKGPEIRLGNFKNGKEQLKEGQLFTLTMQDVEGTGEIASVTYKELIGDIKEGQKILIDDGLIAMQAVKLTEDEIICKVLNDGEISNHKGVNVPDVHLSMPYISEKDYEDILFGIKQEFDFIAASFVRTAKDVLEIRKILKKHDCDTINIISKIENREGVEHIDEIIQVSDAIMVARGDMGVEIPFEEVPAIQKMIIRKVYLAGKQVVTATQMLDSMMHNPRPTRAEAADVANAIYDGTSSIMLSGETAAGKYPVEALQTMVKIAKQTENHIDYKDKSLRRRSQDEIDITKAISHATCTTAADLDAAAIVTVTKSGFTARMISRNRPNCPIVGCSTEITTCRQLALSWGVYPLWVEQAQSEESLLDTGVDAALKAGLVQQGDLVVITAGIPLGVSGTTNTIKVTTAGHITLRGTGIGSGKIEGNVCICRNIEELKDNFKRGDIIVAKETNNEMLYLMKEAGGIIVEEGHEECHAAVVGLTLEKPVLIGARHATSMLKNGAYIVLDAMQGVVKYKNN
ncbi:pyruvate kinase [Eubacterium oxidoreducens]|uniref:Pyruvate kinase n=1 Tax=Eubacterium oxidoreducens TaxID=1732 RepID=A0A1G6AEF1_EUBOX|nr:pyruvate kinase [Eubacterium oxidoreducens]SDB06473.1 pyruvate kinase [Eubacterium oxidoreducens]